MKHLAALTTFVAGMSASSTAATLPPPNILWLVSEDNTAGFAGPYGDPLARTPNIDRLAANGIVFERAFATAPVCAPARSSIITGLYASSLGTQHMRSQRALSGNVRFFPQYLREAGYFCTNNAKTDYNTSTPAASAAWDQNSKTAHWRNRPQGRPFFAVFNTELSHESRIFTREKLTTGPARVRVPPYLPDTPETRADLAQYYDCVSRADEAIGKILAQLDEDGLAGDTIVFYYSDNGGVLPRSKRFLYDNGTHIALVVSIPEKYRHLAPSAHGTRSRELVNFVDLAPTVLSLAGLPPPAHMQGRAFAGPSRAAAPEFTHALRDRMDERYDLSRSVTDGRHRYIRHYMPHRPSGQHLFTLWRSASMQKWDELHRAAPEKLTPAQRAFFEAKPAEELFDCAADPDNVRNLAADPGNRAILERLRAANREHLLRIRDTGFFPESTMIALAGNDSPATIARDNALYPLARIIDLVDACQTGGRADAARIAESSLRDPLPVVRYWAVVSALSRNLDIDVTPLLADPEPAVRVAAAETALRRAPDNDAAWRALGDALRPGQPAELRLAALNALAFLPAPPDALRALVENAATEKTAEKNDEYVPRAAHYLINNKYNAGPAPR